MINKETLIEYFRIISGTDADPNLTLVDFTLKDEQRNIVNLVNEEAKKDKDLANLLDKLRYSNNKTKVIEEYFDNKEESSYGGNVRFCGRVLNDDLGFINMKSLSLIVGITAFVLALVITFATR